MSFSIVREVYKTVGIPVSILRPIEQKDVARPSQQHITRGRTSTVESKDFLPVATLLDQSHES